jgi:hypothetical protein
MALPDRSAASRSDVERFGRATSRTTNFDTSISDAPVTLS